MGDITPYYDAFLIRQIGSAISILACATVTIFYLILFFQTRKAKAKPNEKICLRQTLNDNSDDATSSPKKQKGSSFITKQTNSVNTSSSLKSAKLTQKMGAGIDMIHFLTLSNLCWSICSFLGPVGFIKSDVNNPLCQAQAFGQDFFDCSAVCWSAMIARLIHLSTKRCYTYLKQFIKQFAYIIIYCIFLPLAFNIALIMTNSFAPTNGMWCGINMFSDEWITYALTVGLYFFNWSHTMYAIYAFICSISYYNKRFNEIQHDEERQKETKFLENYIFLLKCFVGVLVLNRTPGSLLKIYQFAMKEDSEILFVNFSFFTSTTGLFNSLVCSYFYRGIFQKEKSPEKVNLIN